MTGRVLTAVRRPERQSAICSGFELRNEVLVEYWTDDKWSWMFCEELEILVGGNTPAEAELLFYRELIDKKLVCVRARRGEAEMPQEMIDKFARIL